MRFLYDNIAAISIAVSVGLMAWLFGGTYSDLLVPVVPWLVFFLFEAVLIFPQKLEGESTYDARGRVWRAMKKDPLVWTAFGLVAVLAVPFFNNGLCPSCDAGLIAQGMRAEPPVPYIPFCVNRIDHLNVFLWFAMAMTAMVAARHGLVARGRRTLIELLVWNGAVLAVLGFVQAATSAPGPLWQPLGDAGGDPQFFSTFGYPNMAGDYFTVLFGLSIAAWRRRLQDLSAEFRANAVAEQRNRYKLFWRKHFYLVFAAIFFFAAVNTLSRAAMMLVTSFAFIAFLHSFLCFTRHLKRAERLRKCSVCLLALGIVVFLASYTIPASIQREVDSLDTDVVLSRVAGKGQYHERVASEIWEDNVLFGCGGWGYKHFSMPKLTEKERKSYQRVGGVNVHNDYLQFLAEHGLVGFGAMVALVMMLLYPVAKAWAKLVKAARFAPRHDAPAKPVVIFALPGPACMVLLACLATFIHGFGDCPFRSPAILTMFFVALAAVPGYLPPEVLGHEDE